MWWMSECSQPPPTPTRPSASASQPISSTDNTLAHVLGAKPFGVSPATDKAHTIYMSGRGRGRGGGRNKGGYVPPSGAQLYLQRSAQECGLDSRNLRALQDVTRPVLYPDLKWHSNGSLWQPEGTEDDTNTNNTNSSPPKRSSTTTYLIQKQREIHRRMQTSAHYLRHSQETDVVRYHSQNRKRKSPETRSDAILNQMGNYIATISFVPMELLGPKKIQAETQESKQQAASSDKTITASASLDELEAQESHRRDTSGGDGVVAAEEDVLGNLSDLDNEEEEEGEDYVMNYYESEEESEGGGGDHEPTF